MVWANHPPNPALSIMSELHLLDDRQAETLVGGRFSFKSNGVWLSQSNTAANIAIGGPAAIFNLQGNVADVTAVNA
jgi:hypothetical protein